MQNVTRENRSSDASEMLTPEIDRAPVTPMPETDGVVALTGSEIDAVAGGSPSRWDHYGYWRAIGLI